MSRCTGHCCRAFYLPYSPAGLQQALMRARAEESGLVDGTEEWDVEPGMSHGVGETEKIVAMVIHLGEFECDEEGNIELPYFGKLFQRNEGQRGPHHRYTCKHLDTDSGDCTDYENRPNMCRDYPEYHESGCEFSHWCTQEKT